MSTATVASATPRLTPAERAAYAKDGIVIPETRLSPAAVGRLREALDQLIADNPDRRPEQLVNAHLRKGPEGIRGNDVFLDMAGLAGTLLVFQYSVHPFFGAAFGPLTFMICVLGGLGNMVGAFIASFIMSEIISIAGVIWSTEMGYVIAFVVFIVMMFIRPGGILARSE